MTNATDSNAADTFSFNRVYRAAGSPPPFLIGEQYRPVRRLGAGGMGTVYEARDVALSRTVALKVIHPVLLRDAACRQRFLRELGLQARLNHPNIIPAYNGGECPVFGPFIVMPLVTGPTLKARLAGRRAVGDTFDVRAAAAVMYDVARGLEYMHAQGLMHRDVKPSNILLPDRSGPAAQLFDFGIARAVVDRDHLTATGDVVGTVMYMSSEQAAGNTNVDQRTDMYSLGVVGWEMLRAIDSPLVRAFRPDVPCALSDLIEELTRSHPDHRPASTEVVDRLRRVLRQLPEF